jgi:shikimate kinase
MIDDHVDSRTWEQVLSRVRELLAERAPFYRAAADQIVSVDDRAPNEIAARIAAGESDDA